MTAVTTVNEEPWPFLPSESGFALASWNVRRDLQGLWDLSAWFVPLVWQETICRWLDGQVEL